MSDVTYSHKRLLVEGHPDLGAKALSTFTESQQAGDERAELTRDTITYLSRVIPLPDIARILVVGCGPRPRTCAELAGMHHEVTAIEPVEGFANEAQRYLGATAQVIQGSAERMPVPDGSQDAVICESILEHVESPRLSLGELYRVLKAGGAAWIVTTNRWDFALSGRNGEFTTPFFNWFPPVLQEAFVFHHLHFKPALANYSLRPAVHWFTYPVLCRLGRDVGFSRFYSPLDLMTPSDRRVVRSRVLPLVLRFFQRHPVARAAALTQIGHTIVMVKTS